MSTQSMEEAIEKRDALTERLVTALDRFGMDEAVGILASFLSLDKLQEVVEFQER